MVIITYHGLAETSDYDAVCDCIQRSYALELWQLKVRTRPVQKVGESLMEFYGALRGLQIKRGRLNISSVIQGALSSSI